MRSQGQSRQIHVAEVVGTGLWKNWSSAPTEHLPLEDPPAHRCLTRAHLLSLQGVCGLGFLLWPMWSLAVPNCLEPGNLFRARLSQEGNCLSRLESRGGSHLLRTPRSIWQGGWGKEAEQREGAGSAPTLSLPPASGAPGVALEQCLSNELA